MKNKSKIKKVLQMALQKYGEAAQNVIAIEEMSELTKAICKATRFYSNNEREAIIKEIADVELCLQSLKMIHQVKDDEINSIKIKKIDTLEERILS